MLVSSRASSLKIGTCNAGNLDGDDRSVLQFSNPKIVAWKTGITLVCRLVDRVKRIISRSPNIVTY